MVSGAANAAASTFAAGGLYGGSSQAEVVCIFYDAGPQTVTLSNTAITDQNGNVLPSGCDGGLAPGGVCVTSNTGINTAISYNCTTQVSPKSTSMRGTLMILDGGHNTLASVQLR
jgi:hypothetical protein